MCACACVCACVCVCVCVCVKPQQPFDIACTKVVLLTHSLYTCPAFFGEESARSAQTIVAPMGQYGFSGKSRLLRFTYHGGPSF